jgi:hypothetical protein
LFVATELHHFQRQQLLKQQQTDWHRGGSGDIIKATVRVICISFTPEITMAAVATSAPALGLGNNLTRK